MMYPLVRVVLAVVDGTPTYWCGGPREDGRLGVHLLAHAVSDAGDSGVLRAPSTSKVIRPAAR